MKKFIAVIFCLLFVFGCSAPKSDEPVPTMESNFQTTDGTVGKSTIVDSNGNAIELKPLAPTTNPVQSDVASTTKPIQSQEKSGSVDAKSTEKADTKSNNQNHNTAETKATSVPTPKAVSTKQPTTAPTNKPTSTPKPTVAPTKKPAETKKPTAAPTEKPKNTQTPTQAPTQKPTDPPKEETPKTYTYVLNTSTKKFHKPSCRDVDKIKDGNKSTINDTRENVIARGYSPCGHCHP